MNDEELYESRLELVDFVIEAFWDTPSEEFVAELLGDRVLLPDESVNDSMDEGFELLREWREANRDRDVDEVHTELERKYTSLFVGPRPPVLPHETYYRDDTEFIGEGLAAVEGSYGAAGWASPEEYPEEDDFIAVEMAFLRYLIDQQRTGHEEAFGFERVFLDEHLLKWIDSFVDEMREETDNDLFLAAALVCQGFIEFEDELVAQMA